MVKFKPSQFKKKHFFFFFLDYATGSCKGTDELFLTLKSRWSVKCSSCFPDAGNNSAKQYAVHINIIFVNTWQMWSTLEMKTDSAPEFFQSQRKQKLRHRNKNSNWNPAAERDRILLSWILLVKWDKAKSVLHLHIQQYYIMIMPSKYLCLVFSSSFYTVVYEALLLNVSDPQRSI